MLPLTPFLGLILLASRAYSQITYNFTVPYSYKYDFNLTAASYNDRVTELQKDNYRLSYINGYSNEDGETLYSAVWDKNITHKGTVPESKVYLNQTADEYDVTFAQLKDRYYPIQLNGYTTEGGETVFATIWEQTPPGFDKWEAAVGLTWEELDNRTYNLRCQLPMIHLASLSGYLDAATHETRFAAVWTTDLSEEYRKRPYHHIFRTNQTREQLLETAANKYSGASTEKPISLSVHTVDGVPYYHSVWRISGGQIGQEPFWTWALGESSEDIPSEWETKLNKVDWPLGLAGFYQEGEGVKFGGVRPVIREPVEEDEDGQEQDQDSGSGWTKVKSPSDSFKGLKGWKKVSLG
ncbi:hypothetical protein BJY04DRAFT_77450 [Aspergillus karnatakaensis]|uniref:uncharacterized protein n=1 Tax=Aspergillus karnatakaensis TaxID=1810916 RepID=UPI003CCD4F48